MSKSLEKQSKQTLVQADSTLAMIEDEHVDDTVARIEALNTEISLNLPKTADVGRLWELTAQLENEAAVNTAKRGLCYLLLKKQLPKNEFQKGLTERGIAGRTARSSMSVAKKLMELPKGKQLAFSQLSGSKLIELAKLDTEVLNELDDDDISEFGSMTVRDMRDEIKQLRADTQQIQVDKANLEAVVGDYQQELMAVKEGSHQHTTYPAIVQECRMESIAMGEQLMVASESLNTLTLGLIELQPDLEDFEHKTAASALYHQTNAAYHTLAKVLNRINDHWGNEITSGDKLPLYSDEEAEHAHQLRLSLIRKFNDTKKQREIARASDWLGE